METESAPLKSNIASHEPELSLIFTCYNEQDVLRNSVDRVLEVFNRKKVDFELVLVDNGSSDRTGQIIDELLEQGVPGRKERILVNEGYGYGAIRGLHAARGRLVGCVPADLQVEAEDIYKIYNIAATATTKHLVKVRRRFRMDGWKRKIVSVIFNLGTNVLFGGLGSIDLNGNPKIFPREYVGKMQLESRDWFIDAEMLIKAKRLGLPVLEFNVLGQMREGGESNIRPSTCIEFIRNLIRWRLGLSRRPTSAREFAPGQQA